jgi:DNA-binding MarR family transcriptional regulator
MTRLSASLAKPMLTDLVGFQLRRVSAQSMTELEKALADLNLRTVHYTVLSTIEASPQITQNDICRAIHMRPANLVPIIRELVQRELVVRREDPADKRIARVSLTPTAQALMDEVHRRVLDHEAAFFGALEPGEREMLMRLLVRIGTSSQV